MTTFLEPVTIDVPIETTEPNATCTAGYGWCEGECAEDEPPLHWGGERWLLGLKWTGRSWVRDEFVINLRVDESEDHPKPLILISDGLVGFTAEQARQTAAELLNAADQIDPLPEGVMATSPEQLHLGDELLTDDGWQTVTGLMFFTDPDQVSVFTNERNEETDGWQLDPEVLVQIRRNIHGSCAIQFIEPIPAAGGTK